MKSKAKVPDIAKNTMNSHKGPVFVVKFNSNNQPNQQNTYNFFEGDGNYCMSGSQDRTIILWNPLKPVPIKTYSNAHNYEVYDICMLISF